MAQWNPVTTLADALRELFGNPNTPVQPGDPWSIAHPVAYTWIWVVGLVVVCAPLAVRAYQRSITTERGGAGRPLPMRRPEMMGTAPYELKMHGTFVMGRSPAVPVW